MIQEQAKREQEVPDVTHPRQVPQTAKSPIMHQLRDKESERKKPDQPEPAL
jgi:hypothetical protein